MRIELGSSRFETRRIFCIGRNYALHAAELGNAPPPEPVVFMKPASCLVAAGAALPLPRGRGAVHTRQRSCCSSAAPTRRSCRSWA